MRVALVYISCVRNYLSAPTPEAPRSGMVGSFQRAVVRQSFYGAFGWYQTSYCASVFYVLFIGMIAAKYVNSIALLDHLSRVFFLKVLNSILYMKAQVLLIVNFFFHVQTESK